MDASTHTMVGCFFPDIYSSFGCGGSGGGGLYGRYFLGFEALPIELRRWIRGLHMGPSYT